MMRDSAGVMRPEAGRFRGRLGWAVVLGTLLGLGIGCGLQGPPLGRSLDPNSGFRWAAADTSRLLRTAHYFQQLGQPELGAKELEEAHRLDPGNLAMADALAQYYQELGLGARAQQVYLETLALAPDNPALQNNLCFSYYQAGDFSQAETCFRKTLARQPDNRAARNNLGLVLCRQGRRDEARQLWQEAEGEAAAARRMGDALAALGLAGELPYVQAARPPGANPVPVAAAPPPAPAASPAVSPKAETPGRAPALPPAVAMAPALTAPPLPPRAPHSRELAAPGMSEERTPKAAPRDHPPGPGLVAGQNPPRPLPPLSAKAVAPTRSPLPLIDTPARPGSPAPQPGLARHPGPQIAAATAPLEPSRTKPRAPITAGELIGTAISILNGNGIQDLARETRSRLSLEGYNVVAINNFRDFGVQRTVIYYRPDSEHVASLINRQFFPGAELEPATRLADTIDVQVVLGRDLAPRQQAEAPQLHEPRL